MMVGNGQKREISRVDWLRKLDEVHIPKHQLNKLVMNYLVIEGYKDAAERFEQESGTSPGVELQTISERMAIRNAIVEGDVATAIDMVNTLNPTLLDTDPTLFFRLKKQEFIELVRKGDIDAALLFAEEELAVLGEDHPHLLEELEDAMVLLAFPDPSQSPLRGLLDPTQRQQTAAELNAALLASQGQEQESRLPILLKTLTWSQKKLEESAVFPQITQLDTATLESIQG